MIPDIQFRNEHAKEEFLSTAAATMAGAYIGHQIDKTKAGRWLNESPTADTIFGGLKALAIVTGVGLFAVFVFCLLTV
jgi:hypothetical protein